MDIFELLKEASKTGEVVFVVYHGGSQPGTKRMISPISVSPTDVEARCIASGELRHFRISKLEVVTSDSSAPEYDPNRVVEKLGVEDFDKCVNRYKSELEKLGWVVKTGKLSISLHSYFKNGKLRKTPEIGILFMEENTVRPWYTFAPDLSKAKSLADLGEAFSLLMEKARSHTPGQS
jgi:hypothetical protein